MANLTAYASGNDNESIAWRVCLSEESSKNADRFRRYRGVRLCGKKNEPLSSVLMRAFAIHKASMIVSGRMTTKVTHVMFFDQFGRVIKTPNSVCFNDLCVNK